MGFLLNLGKALFSHYLRGKQSFTSYYWIFSLIWPIQVGLLDSEVEQGKQVSGKVKGGGTAVFKRVHYPIENPTEENVLN